MLRTKLAGGYHEMGLRQGAALAEEGFSPPPAPPEKLRFARECGRAIRRYVPELLEELEGVAEGGGFDRGPLEALALTLDAEPRCSAVAVSGGHTADGRTLFGRNYDFFASFGAFAAAYTTRPAGALASFGCSDVFLGREDGVNEAGLAVAMAYVGQREERPGIMFHLAARAVLDRCQNTGEAVSFLREVPHLRNTSFLLADAEGHLAVVEAGPDGTDVSRPEGFAAITNHFRSGGTAPRENASKRPADSERRLDRVERWFERKSNGRPVAEGDVRALLADSEGGVCARYPEAADAEDPIVTLWSWTARLGTGAYALAEGSPDETSYETRMLDPLRR